MRRIGGEAFAECEQLRRVQLNEGLEVLGESNRPKRRGYQGRLFYRTSLESVVIPSTLEVLEELTFCGCKNLASVVFAEGSRLREIGNDCFAYSNLKAFEAPPSLRKICNGAFAECKRLQDVRMNEGLEILGEN